MLFVCKLIVFLTIILYVLTFSNSVMQNGVVFFPNSTNIGDDIQTYAASLLVENPVFCDRESLNRLEKEIKLICGGWFMENALNWPPSKVVKPIFISFHISSKNLELMTSDIAIEYYKRHQPIGCRDYHTLNILKKRNVDAYFSGCLTLTIPKYDGVRGEEILFVDVLRKNYTKDYRETIEKNIIPEDYINEVSFISHFSDNLNKLDVTKRMCQAKQLLDRYAKAKIVFTSLIHCALPCIALGTPVVFIDFGFNNNEDKRDRFNGILDLFHIQSDLKAPFMQRNLTGKLARGLRLYHLRKNNITQLSDEIFQYSDVKTKHHDIAFQIKQNIKDYFKYNLI